MQTTIHGFAREKLRDPGPAGGVIFVTCQNDC